MGRPCFLRKAPLRVILLLWQGMYAIAVNLLVCQLKRDTTKQIWFADDATVGGKLTLCIFYVRVLNPYAPSYLSSSLAQCYRKNELEKKVYEDRVQVIEHSSFSSLFFFSCRKMGKRFCCVQETSLSIG